jgi:hypothetical protein
MVNNNIYPWRGDKHPWFAIDLHFLSRISKADPICWLAHYLSKFDARGEITFLDIHDRPR